VRIEVVIAEVTLSDNDENGFSALGATVNNGRLVSVGGTLIGGSVAGVGGVGQATVTADGNLSGLLSLNTIPRKNDTKILSVPAVTTTHNKEATLFVGESRPVITGNTVAGTTGQVVSTVSQRDIGIQLRVLPLIGKDGSVQLQVSQSVEDILGEVTLDGNQQPIIGRRTTDSFVSARSGEVVVLGGLQRRQQTKQTNRLGPIPFLGDLLGNSKDQDTRTELVIFLRPYVLNNSAVDNLDALSRIDASPMKEDVRKVVDKPVPPFAPSAPAQK